MTPSMIENISKVKQIFIEESQNYIRELKEKTSTLDVGHPKFYQHLDFLIVTNSLLRESAARADFYQPDQPFLLISQNLDQSINLLRDRYFDIDWVVKGLMLEAIDLLSQIINAYCLDLVANPNWITLQAELFRQIKEHLQLDDDKLVQIEPLESSDRHDEPFTLNNGVEDSKLFDDDLSQISSIDFDNSDQELQTLFPSLLATPFDGDLDDLLDLDLIDQDLLDTANQSNIETVKDPNPLPMPEMLVNIFEGSNSDRFLGSDDETELQGFNWNNLDEDISDYPSPEETTEEYEDIDDIWTKISSLESWSGVDNGEVSVLKELEASFNLNEDFGDKNNKIDDRDSVQSHELFAPLEDDDCLFWNPLAFEDNSCTLETEKAESIVQDNSHSLSMVDSQESLKPNLQVPDFVTPEVDTAFEESPIYHSYSPLTLSDLKGASLVSNDHTIKIPLNLMEILGDLSEELVVRKGGMDAYLEELRLLSDQARQTVGLLDPEAATQDKSAIAQLQHTFDKLSNMLDLTQQQADAINQDVSHLRQHLRQSLKHPVSSLVSKFPRLLQNLSSVHGKQVELILQGAEVGIERSLSEPIAEVLEILLRKAFKHGIETPYERQQLGKPIQAKISITATQTNSGITISVSDDGCGLNINKIRAQLEQSALIAGVSRLTTVDMEDDQIVNLIFEPNFHGENSPYSADSTKLSNVRQKIRAVGGKISVRTHLNQGTEFTISFPNPLSLIRVLLIDINRICMAIPSQFVLDVLPVQLHGDLRETPKTLLWRDRTIPIVKLNSLLKLNSPYQTNHLHRRASGFMPNTSVPALLVIQHEENLFALFADGCWHDQEATFHQVEGDISLPQIFLGTVILSNNQAVALLSTAEIVNQSLRSPASDQILAASNLPNPEPPEILVDSVLSDKQIDNLSSLSDFFGTVSSPDILESDPVKSDSDRSGMNVQSPSQPSKVLIVESSANVRRYLAMTLAKSGFVTEQAQDCKEAIALLKASLDNHLTIDVIITDLEMPQMDGFKVLTDIRADASLRHLPVVVLTSRNNEHDQKLASELGATAYFSKPYREQELISKLQELVAQHH
ncbi:MAG: hypothetical protein DCE90_11010 [Pseudanabaena sp.]|nr:MAG: hypothetical protein DCE90_11010 [Pseudanabaena sp.]